MTSVHKRNEKDTNVSYSSVDIRATLNKALTAESDWSDKDELLDVIYWMRQIIGVIIGLVWGILPMKGVLAIILFFLINAAIVYFYFNSFQKLDEEEYGGILEILKEGLMTSFASFIVTWIILYSALHA
ncbi:GEL complex subunit OPTI-like [Tubulanus polymorphus]|uniref:GEL complex subunit OPTI-like n=1 Tax=Tubulanus polymorphus TaxID=672921 RepID=UPI003DA5626A